ncbi:PLK4 [Lepeophtheirus salmonis]|uniref:Serine/threonine-protein kinase SAK n=1 Tax=Lepeophtheirus salmonis TaxID=72036 RepID=A0A7R8CIV8_LEPSM|nr:PLK4 [Lepeophtheirus salmonis]CAF2781599.1 PLK4 [Lepeophtheirus salmonis]
MNLIDSEGGHRYEILSLLGQGGFGKVYRALDENGQDVAIKALDISILLRTPHLKERVNEEVRIHSKLNHNSILSFKNVFQDSTHVYIILEYCPHGDLAAHLRKNRGKAFAAQDCLRWFRQYSSFNPLSSISYYPVPFLSLFYKSNTSKMKFHPSYNKYYLESSYNVKIGDFGLATQLRAKNEVHNTMCGTPISIAPEIVSRVPSDPEPADVWGLGCILYTLLVGTSPFETEGIRSTMRKVVCEEPEFPSSLSVEAKDLLSRMLKKNPSLRISLKDIGNHPFILGEKLTSTIKNSTASWDSGIGTTGYSVNNASDVRRSFNKLMNNPTSSLIRQRSWSEISSIPKVDQSREPPSTLSIASAPSSSSRPISIASPLKAHRLRPTSKKHQLKVGTACILNGAEVQLEFPQKKEGHIIETFLVSPNGKNIAISSIKRRENYTYELLPKKYWQKYNYAARYIKFVREKTPKITYWSDKAKFQLMENGPAASFEAQFYEHLDSTKIVFTSQTGIRLSTKDGESLGSYSYPLSLKADDSNGEKLRHFEEFHTRCKRIEDLLESNEATIGSSFPLTVGKKPPSLEFVDSMSNNPQPPIMRSSVSNFSVRSHGIRSFFSDRTTRVDFEDDTRIELGPDDEIKYYKNGRLIPLSKYELPHEVKIKLARIDSHIKTLRSNPTPS